MEMSEQALKFLKIHNQKIFDEDFNNFTKNNIISFQSGRNIAILYAPNGTGKTSLATILNGTPDTEFKCEYNKTQYDHTVSSELFHVINDQNGRNIIQGETEDFILGDDIRAERQLEEEIKTESEKLLDESRQILKKYGISKKSSELIDDYPIEVQDAIRKLAKQGGRVDECIDALRDIKNKNTQISKADNNVLESELTELYIKEKGNSNSIISRFLVTNISIAGKNEHICEISENTDAISILEKYPDKTECIVCDHNIITRNLLKQKQLNKEGLLREFDQKTRKLIEEIAGLQNSEDLFEIKIAVEEYFKTQDSSFIDTCKKKINVFGANIAAVALYEITKLLKTSTLFDKITTHEEMVKNPIKLTEADEVYLQEVVSQGMGKEISIARTEDNRNIIITLQGCNILNHERNELPLSAGEQNFLSLAFEMLKAKNSKAEIIIVDDPISSFDSIYKYKIIYSILYSLKSKKVILLTHNQDLVRLIKNQNGECFSLYLFNNFENGENGFIEVSDNELNLMTDLSELTQFFRTVDSKLVKNRKLFLTATVPFMRSYAKIIGNNLIYDKLTKIMHGHGSGEVDIAACYRTLFPNNEEDEGKEGFCGKYTTTSESIANINLMEVEEILNAEEYPLLNKTLINTIKYLSLRLLVERNLITRFNIPMKYDSTNKIILKAYSDDKPGNIQKRTKLMAKKTLLNEFNHYEGNLSIFQPAIDISEESLKREIKDIENFFDDDEWKEN